MKKNLKKYQEFLKENSKFKTVDEYLTEPGINWGIVDGKFIGKFEGKNYEEIISNYQQWLHDLREDFAESIKNCAMGSSYSDLCKKTVDPNDDFKQIEKELKDDCGWNFESIKNLFSDFVNTKTSQVFDDFVNSFGLGSENGLVDIYLYKLAEKLGLDPNIVRLGGDGWADHVKEDREEVVIRYRYGYHHTKYGQLMLDQIGWSKQSFVIQALETLQSTIFHEWSHDSGHKETMRYLNMKDYSIVDDDRLIIYIEEIRLKLLDEGINMSREDIIAGLIRCVDGYGLDVIDTGSELVFSETTE